MNYKELHSKYNIKETSEMNTVSKRINTGGIYVN